MIRRQFGERKRKTKLRESSLGKIQKKMEEYYGYF